VVLPQEGRLALTCCNWPAPTSRARTRSTRLQLSSQMEQIIHGAPRDPTWSRTPWSAPRAMASAETELRLDCWIRRGSDVSVSAPVRVW